MTDPLPLLGLSTFLIFAVWLVPQARLGWPLWLRAAWGASIFAALTLLIRMIIGSPLNPHFAKGHEGELFWQRLVEAGWWLVAARGTIGLIRIFFVLEHRPRETRIISDLIAGVVYIATMLAIVNFGFAIPIGGLIATSGIIAIVLGLALQSTLADVFSGLAVGIERPYRIGDLLWLDGDIEGRVIEMNWRSTHIGTDQNNIAIVPNSVIAKARLINRSRPTTLRSDIIEVALDVAVPPERCFDALTAAIHTCGTILQTPAPKIRFRELKGDGSIYRISFAVASSDTLGLARSDLLREIHRHLRHNGIAIATAGVAVPPAVPGLTASAVLEQSDLFGIMEPAQRDFLASHFITIALKRGETLFEEGGVPDALYVVASGAAKVTIGGPDTARIVHLTGPGESLGAVGLITGAHYAATATALTPLKAFKLDKTSIATAIKNQPALSVGLEILAQRGLLALREDAAAHKDVRQEQPEMLLLSLRNLLNVLKSR